MFWFTARTQNTFTVYPISLCMCFSLQSIVIDMKTFSLLCSLSTIHRYVTVTLSETLCSLLEWMCAKKNSRLCMYAIISGFLCGSVVWLSSVGCVGVRIFFSSKEYDRSNDADRAKNNPRILTEMMKKAINQSDCWPKTWRQRKKRS